ncbi:Toll/interleukin-1 receptor domain-containing protein [Tanacetum coccineum]|uniref:Toll/interleukin-1 receptor domain-containing protein n=1 Tax=Tanacetum coccineum TaxID=301880 RepID=A0ABQ5EGV0_9ASTR
MASTSSSCIQKSFKYDVFLSFRGEDTRNSFVGHLYEALKQKGIETYKDDEKIEKGERINDQLLKSIEESRIFIIVFSKTYASSSWCLDELVKIMECQMTAEQTAYPVFFDVEPTQVRKQSGPVGEAFARHNKVKAAGKWRNAMKEVADLAGWELKMTVNRDESKLVQTIVDEIFKKLRSIISNVDGKLVGMEMRIQEFLHIKKFEGKSFVENVREVSKTSLSGLKSLQKQVLSDVLNDQGITVSSVHDGKHMMEKMMPGRKVLVVLDDVDNIEQLEALAGKPDWFKSGSMIIITTRDEQVLVSHGVSLIRDVNLLSSKEALCLFSRLKTVPQKETQKVLEISFDDLENDYKEIFLDVACILKGEQKDRAIQVFESCGFNAIIGLRVLEQKSLITITEYGSLDMHDHIEEMGKNIATVNEAIRCIKLSPLTLNLATVMRGLGNMRKLRVLYMCSGPNWKDNQVNQRFPSALKYLSWRDYPFSSLHETFQANNLVGLDMSFSIIENIRKGRTRKVLEKLRFLDLSYTPLQTMNLGVTPNIESLYLEHCQELIELYIPDGCPKLQYLNLNNSKLKSLNLGPSPNLETLSLTPGSRDLILGVKVNLEAFNMPFRCPKLKSLSLNNSRLRNLDFGPTPDLETLSLVECNLEAFNMPFRCPKLKSLSLNGSNMRNLHMSVPIWILKAISHHLNGSKLRNLHLGLTPDLETLSLAGCDLEELHVPFGCPKLISLSLNSPKLSNLNLGPTPDLENLNLAGCDLVELHMPFGYPKLISLIVLNNSKLRNLKLGPTPKLENLSLAGCDLEELHAPFGFPKLKSLSLNSSGLKNFILGPTPDLEILSLIGYNLVELHMPSRCLNLRSLDLCYSKLRSLDIELTPNLERLDLKDCLNLTEINAPVGCLKKLVYLNLSGCGRFKSFLFDKQSKLLEVGSLSELHLIAESKDTSPFGPIKDLSNCLFTCFYKEVPAASSFGNLEELIFIGMRACTNLESFSRSIFSLNFLRKLTVEGIIVKVPKDLHRLEYLEELVLSNTKIKVLPDSVCKLKQLKSLKLHGHDLKWLPKDFGQLESLEQLNLSGGSIEHLPDSLCMLKELKVLNLESCDNLRNLPSNFHLLESLEELSMSTINMKNFPPSVCLLKQLKSLKLRVLQPQVIEKLPKVLGQLVCLEELSLSGITEQIPCDQLLDSICMLEHLKSLELSKFKFEKAPEDIWRLQRLEKLIFNSATLKDISNGICEMKHLKQLCFRHCYKLKKLPDEIGCLECLEELDLTGTYLHHLPQSIFQLKGLRIIGRKRALELCNRQSEDMVILPIKCTDRTQIATQRVKICGDSVIREKYMRQGLMIKVNQYVDRSALLYLILANETLHALHPNIITIAEDATLYPGLCEPTSQGGLGFDYYVNPRASNMWLTFLEDVQDSDWSMSKIVDTLVGIKGSSHKMLLYSENHNQSISRGRSFAEILFGKTLEQSAVMNDSLLRGCSLHKMIRLITYTIGGRAYLNFMGNKFAHPKRVEFPTESNDFSFSLANWDWDLRATPGVHQDLLSFEKDMTDLNKIERIISRWLPNIHHVNDTNMVISYLQGPFLFIFNFHPSDSYDRYNVGVEEAGESQKYSGQGSIVEDQYVQKTTIRRVDAIFGDYAYEGLKSLYILFNGSTSFKQTGRIMRM